MKKRMSKLIWLVSALGVLFFVPLPAAAYDNQTIDRAEESYQKGLSAFEQQRWSDAATHFYESHTYIPMPLAAFYLSASLMWLEDPEGALKYAQMALSGTPPLGEAYRKENQLTEPERSQARKIIAWSQDAKRKLREARAAIEFSGKADAPRPKLPPPPKLHMPRKSKLGIARRTETPKFHGKLPKAKIQQYEKDKKLPRSSRETLVKGRSAHNFAGFWRNSDPNLRFIQFVEIVAVNPNRLRIRAWLRCNPTPARGGTIRDCQDWGVDEVYTTRFDKVVWKHNEPRVGRNILTLEGDTLKVFTEGPGWNNYFRRAKSRPKCPKGTAWSPGLKRCKPI